MSNPADPHARVVGQICNVLAHGDRRRILKIMVQEQTRVIDFNELVETLVASGMDPSGRPQSPERIRMNLYHSHLPVMAEARLIDYDWRSKDIRLLVDPNSLLGLLKNFEEIAAQTTN